MKQKEETLPGGEETKQPEPYFLRQYRRCYPKVKRFHLTGDRLVFLDRDYQQAVSHQQQCGKGELTTY